MMILVPVDPPRVYTLLAGAVAVVGTCNLASAQTSEGGESTPVPTPVPTFNTELEGELATRLTFFAIAFVLCGVPALLACVCFAVRHKRRLEATRALQKRANQSTESGEFSLSGSMHFRQRLSVVGGLPKGVGEKGGTSPGKGKGAHHGEGSALGGGEPEATGDVYDLNHTPPDMSLVPPSDVHPLIPFTEDDAVLQDEVLQHHLQRRQSKRGSMTNIPSMRRRNSSKSAAALSAFKQHSMSSIHSEGSGQHGPGVDDVTEEESSSFLRPSASQTMAPEVMDNMPVWPTTENGDRNGNGEGETNPLVAHQEGGGGGGGRRRQKKNEEGPAYDL